MLSMAIQLAVFLETPELVSIDSQNPIADSYFFAYETGKHLRVYSSNQSTYVATVKDIDDITATSFDGSGVVIDRGAPGSTDECGAWLMGVENYQGRTIGYYHGESNCNYPATTMKIHWAETFDNGLTFTKPSSNNVIAESDYAPTYRGQSGRGNFATYKKDGEVFFYATEFSNVNINSPNQNKTISLKTVNAHNALRLWDGTDYQGDAVNGLSPADRPAWGKTIGFYKNQKLAGSTERDIGVTLYTVDNVDDIVKVGTLITSPIDWVDRSNGDNYAYPSIVAHDGSRYFGNSFYLYYTYAYRGEDFHRKRLVRQKVRLVESDTNAVLTELAVFRKGKDTWATTKLPYIGYEKKNTLGHIYTEDAVSRVPLYEVYSRSYKQTYNVTSYQSHHGQLIRISGYIERNKTAKAQKLLVRKFDAGNRNHYWQTMSVWDGEGAPLGWIE